MTDTVYDAGALIAADRGDRQLWSEHRQYLQKGRTPVTTAPVVAQTVRSSRQVQLRMLLNGCKVVPFTKEHAYAVGALLAAAGRSDVVDGHVVHVGRASAVITSDPGDLEALAEHTTPRPTIQAI